MVGANRLGRLEKLLQPFMVRNTIPSFESFRAMWGEADELSRSLIQNEICCPALAGDMDDEHRAVISRYLEMMGVELTVETATLEEILSELKSDT